jgi:hypothetical protein
MHCLVNSFKAIGAEAAGPVSLDLGQLLSFPSIGGNKPSLLIFERIENTVKHHSFNLIWEHGGEYLAEIRAIRYS